MSGEINKPQLFDVNAEPSSVDQRWSKWVKRFEIYLIAKDITEDSRKRALLLNLSGEEVMDIFENLPDVGNTYNEALDALNKHFKPKKNVLYEIFKFRTAKQKENESITQFMARLRSLSATCEFQNLNAELKIQLVVGTFSERLRRKALKDGSLTLEQLLESGRTDEVVDEQAAGMETINIKQEDFDIKKLKKQNKARKQLSQGNCRNCGGKWPHEGGRMSCPARDKTCYKCKKQNHFSNVCKFQMYDNQNVKQIEEESDSDGAVCSVKIKINNVKEFNNEDKPPLVPVFICGSKIKFNLDTGSTSNVIGENVYRKFKNPVPIMKTKGKLFAYQSDKSLPILGTVTTMIQYKSKKTIAKIYVIKGDGAPLLSYKTAKDLGLFNLTYTVNSGKDNEYIQLYPKLFEGVGKLKGKQIHLHIDHTVRPVAQQHRRIPFHLREKVQKEIERLEEADVIEKTEGPTPWVSPVVLVPKQNDPNTIRLCVDMRMPNTAIKRERHITPTIDDIISQINGAQIFSKLDLNDGYHQMELDEESRNITTFSTHMGLRRYKRLSFGISSAAEVFQDSIRQTLVNLKGVINVSDDILVFGKTQEEHDNRLHKTLERLQEAGLTLSKKKCQFGAKKLLFFGYEFSSKGIGVDPRKIETFKNMSTPKNVSEVRSFLGMVNYCGRFIPNLATLTQPLRQLIIKNNKWKWGKREQNAVEVLKEKLIKSQTNSYFDMSLNSQVIVDAGPDGLGAILCQPTQTKPNIIACASKTLTETEKRYSQIEREMLAIVWAIEHFKVYLYGADFTILTDHKPLVSIFASNTKKTSARLERLRLRLQGYNFKIQHIPGNTNPSDFISRHPLHTKASTENNVVEDYVNFVTNAAVPTALTRKEVANETKNDAELQRLKTALLDKRISWNDANISQYWQIRDELAVTLDGIVIRGNKIVIPRKLRERTIKLAHVGHQGIAKTKQLIRSKVWFPGIDKAVEGVIKSCLPCQCVTDTHNRTPVQPTLLPDYAWQQLAIDFAGPYPNGKYAMVVIDEYSRYPILEVINNLSTREVTKKLKKIFSEFGLPDLIKTDNGPPFNGKDFAAFLNNYGCVHKRVTPLWPEANGTVERFMKTLKKNIQASVIENKSWEEEVYDFLLNYRATSHSTTKKSPSEIIFKKPFRSYIPEIIKISDDFDLRNNDTLNKDKMRLYADKRRNTRNHNLEQDDLVLLKQKPINKYTPAFNPDPYRIINVYGSTIVAKKGNRIVKRNASHFKKIPPGITINEHDMSDDEQTELPQHEPHELEPSQHETPPAEPPLENEPEVQDNEPYQDNYPVDVPLQAENITRSQRTRVFPKKYKDFVCK